MARFHRVTVVMIVVLLSLLLESCALLPSVSGQSEDIVTIVRTDKEIYEPGEDIIVNITVINLSNASVHLWAANSPPYEYYIANESGMYVDGGPIVVLPVIGECDLGPYASISDSIVGSLNEANPPGFYRIDATLYNAPVDSVWIRINGTALSNNSCYDYSNSIIILVSGILLGISSFAAAYYLHRKIRLHKES